MPMWILTTLTAESLFFFTLAPVEDLPFKETREGERGGERKVLCGHMILCVCVCVREIEECVCGRPKREEMPSMAWHGSVSVW